MDALQRTVCQIKDLTEQPAAKLVIVAPNGAFLYADDISIHGDVVRCWRYREDNSRDLVYATPTTDFRAYSADVLDLKTWEALERETTTEVKAREALRRELDPDAYKIVLTPHGTMTKKQAEDMGLKPKPSTDGNPTGQYL